MWAADALFRDDLDRMTFLRELALAVARAKWTCVAYCLMTSHYHLVLRVDDGALPIGMHSLNLRYARQFNGRHGMRGHAFAARYDARRLSTDAALLFAYRYVVRNPVEAGICDSPERWPWSSYAATIGAAPEISFVDASCVLDLLGETPDIAIARLRGFVEGS